ncbi:unnamed protein product, partial [Ectocarpus fasciculatus]
PAAGNKSRRNGSDGRGREEGGHDSIVNAGYKTGKRLFRRSRVACWRMRGCFKLSKIAKDQCGNKDNNNNNNHQHKDDDDQHSHNRRPSSSSFPCGDSRAPGASASSPRPSSPPPGPPECS